MIYEFIIEETVSQKFAVEGESLEDAMERTKAMYKDGTIVLDQPDLTHKQISCVTNGECTEWEEF